MKRFAVSLPVIALSLALASCMNNGLSSTGNSSSSANSQFWTLNFGPAYSGGPNEIAYVAISPFTNSGTFSETSNSPGVYMFNNDRSCSYRLSIGGNVFHNGANDTWQFVGMSGSGCGMQTMGSGGGTANGAYPNATAVGGTVTLTTQSSLPTATGTFNWTGSRQ